MSIKTKVNYAKNVDTDDLPKQTIAFNLDGLQPYLMGDNLNLTIPYTHVDLTDLPAKLLAVGISDIDADQLVDNFYCDIQRLVVARMLAERLI